MSRQGILEQCMLVLTSLLYFTLIFKCPLTQLYILIHAVQVNNLGRILDSFLCFYLNFCRFYFKIFLDFRIFRPSVLFIASGLDLLKPVFHGFVVVLF